MIRSTDRIKTYHAGALRAPQDLQAMVQARSLGQPYDAAALAARLRESVAEIVRQQVASGMDCVNDGELSKTNFTFYVRERLSGYELRQVPRDEAVLLDISGRDRRTFPEYFAAGLGGFSGAAATSVNALQTQIFCVGPLQYAGQKDVQTDIDNFKAALQGVTYGDAYLPANTPGTIEHWLRNEYYKSDEEFLYAIADAMHEEYKAIADAGLTLQLDDPDLPDGWQMFPDMSVADYRKYADLRIEALNHALRDIPEDQIRLHVCWGSSHGPHQNDIGLEHIVDLIFKVKASSYSIEASNAVHEHEWRVFKDFKLPEGKTLIPGVAGHSSDFIEHPELIAQRLVRYASLVGKENVMAGTDCGMGTRVGHMKICWAKFEAMAEGSRLATRELWGN